MLSELQFIPVVVAVVSVFLVFLNGGSIGHVPNWRLLALSLVCLLAGFACSVGYEVSDGAWRNLVPGDPYTLKVTGNLDMIFYFIYSALVAWWSVRVYGAKGEGAVP